MPIHRGIKVRLYGYHRGPIGNLQSLLKLQHLVSLVGGALLQGYCSLQQLRLEEVLLKAHLAKIVENSGIDVQGDFSAVAPGIDLDVRLRRSGPGEAQLLGRTDQGPPWPRRTPGDRGGRPVSAGMHRWR